MNLKKMIAVCAALAVTVVTASARDKKQPTGMEDRQVWVNTLVKIADPVLSNLANNTLRENMPQESLDTKRVHRFSHLEAVGRTLCGIAPWLELGADETEEGKLRGIKAFENNWLLFASMVEAALLEFTGECDLDRLTYGVFRFRDDWYKGDGVYGDGPSYHADYYNSFVIHPMLTDVLKVMKKHGLAGSDPFWTEPFTPWTGLKAWNGEDVMADHAISD